VAPATISRISALPARPKAGAVLKRIGKVRCGQFFSFGHFVLFG
jgi:hypothetical protein